LAGKCTTTITAKTNPGLLLPAYGYLIYSFPTKYVHASHPLPTCLKFQ